MPQIVLEPVDLAYMAGLFDGEGSFSILVSVQENKGVPYVLFNPRMTVNMKNSLPAQERFLRAFGGAIYQSRTRPGMQQWVLGRRSALVEAATTLRPYLLVKQGIADRFLEALSLYPESRVWRAGGERAWSIENIVRVAEIAFSLNPATARRSKQTVEYIENLKAMYRENPGLINEAVGGGPPKGSRRIIDPATGKRRFVTPEEADALGAPAPKRLPNAPSRLDRFHEAREAESEMPVNEARDLARGVRGVMVGGRSAEGPFYFIASAKASRPFPATQEREALAEQARLNDVMATHKRLRNQRGLAREQDGSFRATGEIRLHFPLTVSGFAQASAAAEWLRRDLLHAVRSQRAQPALAAPDLFA
jgi:hypothetical protein